MTIKFRVWDNVDYMSTPFTLQDLQEKKIEFTSDCVVMQFTGLLDKNGKEIYEGDVIQFHLKKEKNSTIFGSSENVERRTYKGVVKYEDGSFIISQSSAYPFDRNLSKWSKKYNEQGVGVLDSCFDEERRTVGNYYAEYEHPEIIGNIYETPELL